MSIDFKGRVAIVTGAGGGLGKQHALALAARGAKVLVNDLGGDVHGVGGSVSAAQAVVDEIRAAGGEAMANGASVTDFEAVKAMVQQAVDAWGRVDILVNNAGILRDKSFAKMELADFKLVMDVHVMGAVHCTKAVWPLMQAQNYGRVVMTTSSTEALIPSRAMISRICSRSAGTPWPEPYCIAIGPLSLMTFSRAPLTSDSGSARTYGMPPARETTSGREATAKRARTSDALSPAERLA